MDQDNLSGKAIPDDDTIDFKRYFSLFLNNWYWFAIALFISLTLAYAVNRYSEKLYTVTATMIIKDDQLGGGTPSVQAVMPGGELFGNRQMLENEIGILKSYSINRRVMDSLPDFRVNYVSVGRRYIASRRIYGDTPFVVVPAEGHNQPGYRVNIRLLSDSSYELELNEGVSFTEEFNFGDRFNRFGYDFVIEPGAGENSEFDPSRSNKYYFWFPSLISQANSYRSKLNVSPISPEASLVTLSVTGPVYAQEADYLNMLMTVYLEEGLDLKKETANSTISFIEDQLETIEGRLEEAEEVLLSFRKEKNLIDLGREAVMLQNRIERFETERTELELSQKYYIYLDDYLGRREEYAEIVNPSAMGVADPQLVRLVQELSQLQQQRRLLMLSVRGETEPVRVIDNNIASVRASLGEIVTGGMETISTRLSDVNRRIDMVEEEIAELPATERELISIQRDFDVNNTVYTYLLEKKAEAEIALAGTVTDNRIVDPAYPFISRLVKPRARQNYMIAFVAGLFVPLILIVVLDYFNDRIIDRKDVERGTTVPVIGYISHNSRKTELPLLEHPGSTIAESFRAIRTNLTYFRNPEESSVVVVSSTISSEGKTFISANLATAYAMLGKRVLLVGLDLRRPRIHNILEMDNPVGMSLYLSGQSEYEDIVKTTGVENLHYVSSGPIPPNPAELIESEKMSAFISRARSDYDLIIIDTPPLAIVTDGMLMAPYANICLLVVRQRYTSRNTLGLIQELYEKKMFNQMAIVVNDITLSGYYGYGLRYGYSIGYTYGYNYYDQQAYSRYGGRGKAGEYYID